MDGYCCHNGCLMEFLARALDDPATKACGRCAPCKGRPEALRAVPGGLRRLAAAFLCRSARRIKPLANWQPKALPVFGWQGKIPEDRRAEPGRALCILGDSGWGGLVRRGKYQDGKFADELVQALAGLVRGWRPTPAPAWVTCVPSLTHADLVPDLANRLAARLSLPFHPAVRKVRATRPQKEVENSWQQAHNLDGAFEVHPWKGFAGPVLLVDDIVDSGWTFTVLAALLRQAGSGPVFPLALAANR
jgi:ATP-dependent DNA helicase RecQ